MLHKNGSIGWIESMCVPYYDCDNNIIGSLGVNRDITKRVTAEHALAIEKARLEEEVRVKNMFFSIIAHDLNGPYNELFGFTNILSNKENTLSKDETVNLATKVNDAALQVFNLQKGLLEWSRSQFVAEETASRSASLFESVSKVLCFFKTLAANKNITIINEITETKVLSNPDMIQTVLRNLISNALKFSHSGARVWLSSEIKDGMVQVKVHDNGVGISKEQSEKLFKIEHLTSALGTNGETGVGIGMTLCREIVEKNGGRIWLGSTLTKGTEVYFTLPIE